MTDDLPPIDTEIARARTLPSHVYTDPGALERVRERVFVPSWQLVAVSDQLGPPGSALPVTLLPGLLDEPLVVTRDLDGTVRCLSNVCTHRGNLLVETPGPARSLRCRYHGRRFDLSGAMRAAPGFEGAVNFPSDEDDLPKLATARLGPLIFASLAPHVPFDELAGPLQERLAFFPLDECRLDGARSRAYDVEANWALYCDNYLEGFHIPFVHAELARCIEPESYRTETSGWSVLQLARSGENEPALELPPDSPDAGERIAAYYFWLYPSTMINVYPWGVSVNVVEPRGVDRTRVVFLSLVLRPELVDRGAGGPLDLVEREDEAVVEACQRGVRSRLYDRGRFSPRHEPGVHHFHRLLANALSTHGPADR